MRLSGSWILALCLALATPVAPAYNYQGHQLIGAIADRQLGSTASHEVAAILGFDLRVAGPWADCARGVKPDGHGAFTYSKDPLHPEYEQPCAAFNTPQERARLEDYVRRNWDNCGDAPAGSGCHGTYHYTNVAIQHERYDRAYIGSSEHDVVGAINAAIAVLQGRRAPSPFDIRDRKEALLLLSHFVGDLHQPLHVGAAYIGDDDQLFDPDALQRPPDRKAETRGGNAIRDEIARANLHADWDQKPPRLGDIPDRQLMARARAVAPTRGAIGHWAAAWAGESLRASRSAYAGLHFIDDPSQPGQWIAQFDDHADYWARKEALQETAIVEAGARLAQLLNTIWPTAKTKS